MRCTSPINCTIKRRRCDGNVNIEWNVFTTIVLSFLTVPEIARLRGVHSMWKMKVNTAIRSVKLEGGLNCSFLNALGITHLDCSNVSATDICCKGILEVLGRQKKGVKSITAVSLDCVPQDFPLESLQLTRVPRQRVSRGISSTVKKLSLQLPPHQLLDGEIPCSNWLSTCTSCLTNLEEFSVGSECGTLCYSVIRTLNEHSATLKNLSLRFPGCTSPSINQHEVNYLPNLTTLCISVSICPPMKSLSSLLGRCPRLRKATLLFPGPGRLEEQSTGASNMPTSSSIEELIVELPVGSHRIWEGFTSLKNLKIEGGYDLTTGGIPVPNKSLQRLEVTVNNQKQWDTVWEYVSLACPTATHVVIHLVGVVMLDESWVDALSPSLKLLEVHVARLFPEKCYSCWTHILRTLELIIEPSLYFPQCIRGDGTTTTYFNGSARLTIRPPTLPKCHIDIVSATVTPPVHFLPEGSDLKSKFTEIATC